MDGHDIENIFNRIQLFGEQFVGEQTHASEFADGASWERSIAALTSAHEALNIRVTERWRTEEAPLSQLKWAIDNFGREIQLLIDTPTSQERHRYFNVIACTLGMVISLLELAEDRIQPY